MTKEKVKENIREKRGKSFWLVKAPPLLKIKLDWVGQERVKIGKDKKTRSYIRLLLGIARHDKMLHDLANADFIDDKKGQVNMSEFNIFTWMIVAFLAVVLFAGLIFVTGIMNDAFEDIGERNTIPGVNLTKASRDTFGQMNNSIQALRLVAMSIIFSQILMLIVFMGFTGKHPALFIVWIFVVFLAIIFSAPISNAYESLLQSNLYDGLLASFTGSNWVLLNLPFITLMIGILGGVLMFVNIARSSGGSPQSI